MLFTQKLRAGVKSGDVSASVRIWKTPRVKVGGTYRLDDGHIEVTSIQRFPGMICRTNRPATPGLRT